MVVLVVLELLLQRDEKLKIVLTSLAGFFPSLKINLLLNSILVMLEGLEKRKMAYFNPYLKSICF